MFYNCFHKAVYPLLSLYMKEGNRMAITNIIKQLREERHDSQEDVAIATGSCSRTVGRIERGERNPSLEMAIRIARYFNLSVEDVFDVDDL